MERGPDTDLGYATLQAPLGNILEIYSHSYELTYAAGAYAS